MEGVRILQTTQVDGENDWERENYKKDFQYLFGRVDENGVIMYTS